MGRLLGLAILGGAFLSLAACNRNDGPARDEHAPAPPTTGITGICTLTVVPGIPGKDADPPGPVGGMTIRVSKAGAERLLTEVKSEADGRFRIPVEPGMYDVETRDAVGGVHKQSVIVPKGGVREVRFDLVLCAP